MDLKGTKTEKNIIEALIQETQSAMTYDYAGISRRCGRSQ